MVGGYHRPSDANHHSDVGCVPLEVGGGGGCGSSFDCGGYHRPSEASHQSGPLCVSLIEFTPERVTVLTMPHQKRSCQKICYTKTHLEAHQ